MGGCEVFVELGGELAVVAGFGDFVPRCRIRGEEGTAGHEPGSEEFLRQRIGEAKGDKDRNLALLPVRQFVKGLLDGSTRIEELHGMMNQEGSEGIASLRLPFGQPLAGYLRFAPVLARFLKWRRSREEMRRTGVSALAFIERFCFFRAWILKRRKCFWAR